MSDFNKNLLSNIYYKASNSITIILFTLLVPNSDLSLKGYFLSLTISAYITTFLIVNTMKDNEIGNDTHKALINNFSNLTILTFILSLSFYQGYINIIAIIFTIILKSISDSFVAKKNKIFKRSLKLFFFDILKVPVFIFSNHFSELQILSILLFLSACPDLKIGYFKKVIFYNDNFFTKNFFSLTKNLESTTIYLFVENAIIKASSMVYLQQAISLINVFLITVWQKKIHQKNNYIQEYVKGVSKYIIPISIIVSAIGVMLNSNEILILASMLLIRTILIDPNLFMTKINMRRNLSTVYIGIFIAGLTCLFTNIIMFYYLTSLLLIYLLVKKIINEISSNSM